MKVFSIKLKTGEEVKVEAKGFKFELDEKRGIVFYDASDKFVAYFNFTTVASIVNK